MSNMADIMGSYLVGGQFHQFYARTSLVKKNQTYLVGVHRRPFAIPAKITTRTLI